MSTGIRQIVQTTALLIFGRAKLIFAYVLKYEVGALVVINALDIY